MLVLTREIDQVVMVGNHTEVRVLAIKGRKVLLGFKASKKIPIHREEVYLKIQNGKNSCVVDSGEFHE